jgi:arginyl-tRNA synthetase
MRMSGAKSKNSAGREPAIIPSDYFTCGDDHKMYAFLHPPPFISIFAPMFNAEALLTESIRKALAALYQIDATEITLQKTRKEFEGDFTLVTFPYIKQAKKSPESLGEELGRHLKSSEAFIEAYNVIKGFLNITLSEPFWLSYFNGLDSDSFEMSNTGRTVMVEYASPNTNKPLHLGHIRNILLGHSVAMILQANGHRVINANLVNDRGIHICKSMLAWKKFGSGDTPEKAGKKGDHLVGDYYVKFDQEYKKQVKELMAAGASQEDAEKNAPFMKEAQEMLRLWESGDKEVRELWKMMNGWVYKGFEETFSVLGVSFDKMYYESDTYLLGKEIVKEGLEKSVFYKKDNGSVAIDLTAEGLDEKIVLRGDGTSVYITQDIGTAIERFKQFRDLKQLIYTVGNEQDYHFKVLFKILEKLGYSWAKECYHLSYGMVELPEGKMKSREGTVVDADDLIEEMIRTSEHATAELGKVEDFSDEELKNLHRQIALGALKYFILKVDPKKKMVFNPKESIDLNGHTGPFVQYTHARIKSVLRKNTEDHTARSADVSINALEKDLIRLIYDFKGTIAEAGKSYSPALVANYVYELAKSYNRFYHEYTILKEENESLRFFRLRLSTVCAAVIEKSMKLLGIEVPEKM